MIGTIHPFIVYLLCAERPVGRARHYVGITRTLRLSMRLAEHANQRGATLTAELARRNQTLEVARLWPTADHRLERQIKRKGKYQRECPICQSGDRTRALAVILCPHLPPLEDNPLFLRIGTVPR